MQTFHPFPVQSNPPTFTSFGINFQVSQLLNERKSEFGTGLKAAEDSVSRVEGRVKWAKETTPGVQSWLNKTLEEAWTPQRFKFHDVLVLSHKPHT